MKWTLLIMIVTVGFFSSCKKVRETILAPQPQMLLKDVVVQGLPSPYYHFEYVNGKTTKASFASGAAIYDILYAAGRITEMKNTTAVNKDRILYEYSTDGKLGAIKIIDENGSVKNRAFLSYELDRLVELEWETKAETIGFTLDRTISFTYYNDGNLLEKREQLHAIPGKQESALHVDKFTNYDSKTNVEGFSFLHITNQHFVLFPGIVLMKNNPAKNIRTGTGVNYEISNNYTYNKNLPLQRNSEMLITSGPTAGARFNLQAWFSYY